MTNSRPPRRPRGRSGSSKKAAGPQAEELHPVDEVPDIKTFREFALAEDIQEAIAAMGITEPTPIQKLAIAPVLEGRDVIAKAETGTGKTLAFGAPMMSQIEADRASVLGLVLCPTRELALQVYEVIVELGKPRGIKVALVVGGDPMHPQVKALRDGAQVVVGTPGRVLDLAKQRFLSFPWTEFAVLDEADEMLEIGFIDDVRKILDMCSEDRQTLLFSATFPPELLRLARDHTKNPIEVATAKGVASVENITHYVTQVDENDRDSTLKRLIHSTADDDVLLVFCDRRVEVERVLRSLERTRLNVKALHGGYDQAARTRVMAAFRDGSVKVLVATDVASRGLDIKHVTHVINLSVPRSISAYTHRSGRTGRAGAKGAALTVVVPSDKRRWRELESQMTWKVVDFDERQRNAASESSSDDPKRRERSRSQSDATGERESRPRRSERSPRSRDEQETSNESNDREERPRRGERSSRPSEDNETRSESTSREERPRRSTRSRRPSEDNESRSESTSSEERPRRGARSGRPSEDNETRSESTSREERPRRSTRSRRPSEDNESRNESTSREERPRRGARSRRPSADADTQHETSSQDSRPKRTESSRSSEEESTPRVKMPVRQTRRSEHERRQREMEQAAAELNAQSQEQAPNQETSDSRDRAERPRRSRRTTRTSETQRNAPRSEQAEERAPRNRDAGENETRSDEERPRRKARSARTRNENESSPPSDSPRRENRTRSRSEKTESDSDSQTTSRPRRTERPRRTDTNSKTTKPAEKPTPPKPESSGGGFGAGI
ncbi:MAG: superfamily II DNA/RNA helicase [Planctomycetota bacterium]|jgi:superfamily II DNA/RNA helicase